MNRAKDISTELMCLVADVRVLTPSWKRAISRANRCYALAKFRIKRSCLIVGESGTGKTAYLEHLLSLFPESRTADGVLRPALYVETPNDPTAISLLEELLRAMGDPRPYKGTGKQKMDRVVKMLDEQNVLLILLDDLHHFVDKNQNQVLYEASECLKEILIRSRSSLIGAGLHDAKKVIGSNEQLKRRFVKQLLLPRYDWKDESSRKIFVEILGHFHGHLLKHFDLPMIYEDSMALRFYLASGGIIDFVAKILTAALCDCIEKKRRTITLADLRRARDDVLWDDGELGINPFREPFDALANYDERLLQASKINQKVSRPVSKRGGAAKKLLTQLDL